MEDPAALDAAGVDLAGEFVKAKANGVETVRFPIYWSSVQPYAKWSDVPAGRRGSDCVEGTADGAPWCLGLVSKMINSAALNDIRLVPILLNAPRWAADLATYPTGPATGLTMQVPKDFDQFAAFAKGLAQRFGPGGSLLPVGKPSPIAAWQIWNEPNFRQYWPQHVGETQTITRTVTKVVRGKRKVVTETVNLPDLYFAPSYLNLVKRTRTALRSVDPKAKIMLASIANGDFSVRPQRAARAVDLDFIYKAGGKGSFDIAAANIFTGTVNQLATRISDYRTALKAGGDTTLPLALTEFSWVDRMGLPKSAFRPGQLSLAVGAGQARCTDRVKSNCPPTSQSGAVTAAIDTIVRNRTKYNLWGAYWHSWATDYSTALDGSGFVDLWRLSGLRQVVGSTTVARPSLKAFCVASSKAKGLGSAAAALACES